MNIFPWFSGFATTLCLRIIYKQFHVFYCLKEAYSRILKLSQKVAILIRKRVYKSGRLSHSQNNLILDSKNVRQVIGAHAFEVTTICVSSQTCYVASFSTAYILFSRRFVIAFGVHIVFNYPKMLIVD